MAEMTDKELAVLADTLEKKVFEPGDLIFSEGENSTSLYLIESGEVSVVLSKMGADIQIARICAGGAFGEMGLIDGLPRSAGVRAVTEVACWCLDYTSLGDVSRADRGEVKFKLMRNIAATLSERLRVANDEIRSFR
jgi:CRP-like cAMP-binding protein